MWGSTRAGLKINKSLVDRIFASFAAMDVNTALRLLAAMVVLTSQPYNTEGMFMKTIVLCFHIQAF